MFTSLLLSLAENDPLHFVIDDILLFFNLFVTYITNSLPLFCMRKQDHSAFVSDSYVPRTSLLFGACAVISHVGPHVDFEVWLKVVMISTLKGVNGVRISLGIMEQKVLIVIRHCYELHLFTSTNVSKVNISFYYVIFWTVLCNDWFHIFRG